MHGEHFAYTAMILSLAACLCTVVAYGTGCAHPRSCYEAIAGPLANVKSR